MHPILSFFFYFFFLTLVHSSPTCPRVLPTTSPISPRIVGGITSLSPTHLHVSTFHRQNFGHYACTAVLVSPLHLISAAHCHINATTDVAVLLGPSYESGIRIPIRRVLNLNQTFDYIYDRDLAFIELKFPAPRRAKFAKLNIDPNLPLPDAYARVIGYGRTGFDQRNEGVLRSVDIPIVKQGVCRGIFHTDLILTSDMVCAGKKGCDACQGDSGGPLVQYDEQGHMVVVGVVSSGIGCGGGTPGVYMRIQPFLNEMKAWGMQFQTAVPVQVGGEGGKILVGGVLGAASTAPGRPGGGGIVGVGGIQGVIVTDST